MRQMLAGATALLFVIALNTRTLQVAPWTVVGQGDRTRATWKYPFQAIIEQRQHGIRFADQFDSIQSAVDDAGTHGAVVIPPGTPSGNPYSNVNNIPVLDLRRSGAEIGIWSQIAASRPIKDYPLGADVRLIAHGAADLWLAHDTNDSAKTTTTTTLSLGSNRNVRVGDTSKFSARAPIWIGRETDGEEQVSDGKWEIVDRTHINVVCRQRHSGTTDVEQVGSTILDGGDRIILKPENPSQISGHQASIRFYDYSGNPLFYVPGNARDGTPAGTFRMFVPLILGNGTRVSKLQHKRTVSCVTGAAVGANCDSVLEWDQSFGDTNYTVTCNVTNVTNQPRIMSVPIKTPTQVSVRMEAATAAPAKGTIECTGLHD